MHKLQHDSTLKDIILLGLIVLLVAEALESPSRHFAISATINVQNYVLLKPQRYPISTTAYTATFCISNISYYHNKQQHTVMILA